MAAAAFLGIVGGAAVGFTIQAGRPPTPLPALAQQGLTYPAEPLAKGTGRGPLAAKDDRRVITDGDLRKQLVPGPPGANIAGLPIDSRNVAPRSGWLTASQYAQEYVNVAGEFTELTQDDVRRIAAGDWSQGQDRTVSVRLVQFRAGSGLAAQGTVAEQLQYLTGDGGRSGPVKGSGNATYVLLPPDGSGYEAMALGWRGDVMFEISVFDSRPISEKDIRTLAERQLERL
ncbi:hypothetical protein [Streptomyces sp. NBC_00859]|uniref:hypothetical protein n=1 Tax=Streptomyces sp. NBC_00859 TaxID=2903682 RepID=UPI0038650DD5|nr:hypothetical protein OG584_18785 [Streptomyces sp. NBC_00859]